MKAEQFDKKFDENKADIADDLDLSTAEAPNQKQKRVNVDFPAWIIESLDKEASRIGVTRQSIIKLWLVERLEEKAANKQLKRMVIFASMKKFCGTLLKTGSNPSEMHWTSCGKDSPGFGAEIACCDGNAGLGKIIPAETNG